MSSVEVGSHHYSVRSKKLLPYEFHHPPSGLELDRIAQSYSVLSSSSAASHHHYLQTHPPTTPQELLTGSYFYSPAHTPYNLEDSPTCDQQSYKSNYYPSRAGLYLRDDEMAMLVHQSVEYLPESSDEAHVYETWDETLGRTLPSPTPSDDSLESLRMSTRNASIIASTNKPGKPTAKSTSKGCRAPRKRKAPNEKVDKPKLPKLTKPLSELTKNYHHLPIRNMENWVHRTAEVRWQEVEKRGGYVTRPMNSFMLYRSAFAERTKLWCLQNNHQVVSSVSGESWPLEPDQIREKYNDLAKIERINHQAAHPGYKFSPSKAQGGRKRKGPGMGKDDENSTIGELDDGAELGSNGSPGIRSKRAIRGGKRTQKAPNSSLVYLGFPYENENGGAHRSSFNHNNPGKTPPMCMGTQDMNGQYYQTTVRASSATPIPNPMPCAVIEDITIRKTQAPAAHSSLLLQHQFIQSGDLQGHPQLTPIKTEPEDNSKVDPMLLSGDERGGYIDNYHHHHNMLPSHYMRGPNSGSYDFEPFFSGTGGQMLEAPSSAYSCESGGAPQQEGLSFSDGNNCRLLDGTIDVHKLPGYSANMAGFLDNEEPWNVEEAITGGEDGGGLCYDEWLQ